MIEMKCKNIIKEDGIEKKCKGNLKIGDTSLKGKKVGEHIFCDTCNYEKDIDWKKSDDEISQHRQERERIWEKKRGWKK